MTVKVVGREMPGRVGGDMVRTAVHGLDWPALPAGNAAVLLSILHQLDYSQWWPPEQMERAQFRQLGQLLGHCWRTVPFYRSRLEQAGWTPGTRIDGETWRRLPLLTREEVQSAGTALHSTALPRGHGPTHTIRTSGSTGKPVTVVKSNADGLYWHAFLLRDHLWHRHDFSRRLAVIRVLEGEAAAPPDGLRQRSWGGMTGRLFRTGPAFALHIGSTAQEQLAWLRRVQPGYLLTVPSTARTLAQLCRENGVALPGLQAVLTMGEVCTPDTRAAVAETWNVPVHDAYSSQEVGYMALQCPDHGHYHLQPESALVEVLDEDGKPCPPGRLGRIVATPLHNFAMPLVRYDIGDYAEVGTPCPCGRGLPVVTRIAGRVRNMLRLPDGGLIWPLLASQDYRDVAPVRQAQIAQVAPERLEARVIPERPLTPDEEMALRDKINARIGYRFEIAFTYPVEIPRGPGGKFEDFRCELPAGPVSAAPPSPSSG